MATKTDGTLWTWGNNGYGNLGQNNTTNYSSPVQVPGTTWGTLQGQVSNGSNGKAVKTDGTLWVWGDNEYGELGLNQPEATRYSSPVQVPGTQWDRIRNIDSNATMSLQLDQTP